MIRKLTRIFFFLFALIVTAYGVITILPDSNRMVIDMYKPIQVQIPDWSSEELLAKINEFRASEELPPLTNNDKLTAAAKSRLAVIMQFEDYEGTETGVTREKSLEVVGYRYSWVGDLVLMDLFKRNDPIEYWKSIDNSLLTLKDKNLKEVGVAIKQTPEQVTAYLVLATPAKAQPIQTPIVNKITWGGPELFSQVNKRRVEYGVNPLKQLDELCTIASIRLNQILDLGKLDGHSGFEPTLKRDDLKWISEKYNISEFLVSGYSTAAESIKAWEATLGHKKLLSGGEYVYGCVYAQSGYGVAIAAY